MKKHPTFRLCMLCTLFLLSLCLCGCGRSSSAPDVLRAVCSGEAALPAGRYYFRSASPPLSEATGEPSEFYGMDEKLFAALFGDGSLPAEADCITECACYFSYTEPNEISVFLCKSSADAERVAKLCLRRLEFLRTHYRGDGHGGVDLTEKARILRSGRWVLFCVSQAPEETCHAFRRAL